MSETWSLNKLALIHASVTYLIHWISIEFKENANIYQKQRTKLHTPNEWQGESDIPYKYTSFTIHINYQFTEFVNILSHRPLIKFKQIYRSLYTFYLSYWPCNL